MFKFFIQFHVFILFFLIIIISCLSFKDKKRYIIGHVSDKSGLSNKIFGVTSSFVISLISHRKYISIDNIIS